jgi:hypothetical protein
MKHMIAAVLVSLVVSGPAWGKPGNDVYTHCRSGDNFSDGICMGYIQGVADALNGPERGMRGRHFCIPEQATYGQIKAVVIKWFEANPQLLHYAAFGLVANALSKAFPCK